jgi:hypothetical protein
MGVVLEVGLAKFLIGNADLALEELAQQRSLILRSIATGSRECAPDDKLRDASRRMDAMQGLAAILRDAAQRARRLRMRLRDAAKRPLLPTHDEMLTSSLRSLRSNEASS